VSLMHPKKAFPPTLHAPTHHSGGVDEIDATLLKNVDLADGRVCKLPTATEGQVLMRGVTVWEAKTPAIFERYASGSLPAGGTYVIATKGLFNHVTATAGTYASSEERVCVQIYSDYRATWFFMEAEDTTDLGYGGNYPVDGANVRLRNRDTVEYPYALFRFYTPIFTYERVKDGPISGGGTYTPTVKGFFVPASEDTGHDVHSQLYSVDTGWQYLLTRGITGGYEWLCPMTPAPGDGGNYRVKEITGVATYFVLMVARV